jgi:hypothetical protein
MITAASAYDLAMNEGRRKKMAEEINMVESLIIETCKNKGTWVHIKENILPEVYSLLESSGYNVQRDFRGEGITIYWLQRKGENE